MTAAKPGKHLATQTLHPWRTAIRTGISTGLFFLAAIAAAAPVAAPFAEQYIPDAGTRILAFGVFCGGLALVLKRIGAIPAVARLLVLLGVGVIPRSELTGDHDDDHDQAAVNDVPQLQFTYPSD